MTKQPPDQPSVAPVAARPTPGSAIAYAELHCHSDFSFLDGASSCAELVDEAVRLGLTGLAITDHDGLYGVVRHAEAARLAGLPTVFGAELTLSLPRAAGGLPDPEGSHLLVLARGSDGYTRLSRVISRAQLAGGEKGHPVYDLEQVAAELRDHVVVLTGCRKGTVRAALEQHGPATARRELDRLVELFGNEAVVVEVTDHDQPLDDERNNALITLANDTGLSVVATNNVHYATPARRRLATAIAAVRARRSLREMEGWLPAAATAHLRSAQEMARRFVEYPHAVTNAARLAAELSFDLQLLAPQLPPFPVPAGHTEDSWLRHLALTGADQRYGPRAGNENTYRQIDKELRIIAALGYAGYFLVVHDLVEFCRRSNIYSQGRGSAANSTVCYALGITNADPIAYRLLFERFLSPERDGPPDIDLDIENGRREEVIQYVYTRHGRENAAQVANVITYRRRSAVRDMARAFGYSSEPEVIPPEVHTFAEQLRGAPRHLGIHSGGMVICDRPIIDIVPVEWARMAGRSVLQWDKDDCATAGLVKFDLLGLGMLSALHHAVDFIRSHYDTELNLAKLPPHDEAVFAMIREADTIGVFQIESRAQMSMLPRLKPRQFYDLVVAVALVRPGPIQGGAVHPYIRRVNGEEPVTYPHPLTENALKRTHGVILYQEQVQLLAIDLAGFSAAEADQLRRAMGSKRSTEQMRRLRERLFSGMAARGISGALAEDIYTKMEAFSGYGFPESHSISFAHVVWQSCYLKRYYPAAFTAALLKAYPLGFYNPQTLTADARRHGVTVLRPDINHSAAEANLEGIGQPAPDRARPRMWGIDGPIVRLGLNQVRGISDELAATIAAAAPFTSMTDVARRTGTNRQQLEALATAGAFASLGIGRREALWAAGPSATDRPDVLPHTTVGATAPTLPGMDALDLAVADTWATGLSVDSHPVQFIREQLNRYGALPITDLVGVRDGRRVLVGGIVTHRQRPETAGGILFLSLEDETGILNVVCSPGLLKRYGKVTHGSRGLLIQGQLQSATGAINLVAEKISALEVPVSSTSRDFR